MKGLGSYGTDLFKTGQPQELSARGLEDSWTGSDGPKMWYDQALSEKLP